jgi:hypothetical protein
MSERLDIGMNCGVVTLSKRRAAPTIICGLGRSGTTCLTRCVVVSRNLHVVADEISLGSNLEANHLSKNVILRNDAASVEAFRRSTSKNYHKEFIVKIPDFEIRAKMHASIKNSWKGANLIVMTRDAAAVASREFSVGRTPTLKKVLQNTIDRSQASMNSAVDVSSSMGVVLVSYEKLLTSTRQTLTALNAWFGFEAFDVIACERVVVANERNYLNRQSEDISKRKTNA